MKSSRMLNYWMGASMMLLAPVMGCTGSSDDDTESPTPVVTPTPTQTPGVTPTATVTPDPTPTDTPEQTPTPTPRPTPTPSPTPVVTPPPTPTPALDCASLTPVTIQTLQTGTGYLGKQVRVAGAIANSPLTPAGNAEIQAFYLQEAAGGDNTGIRVEVPTNTVSGIAPGKIVSLCAILKSKNSTVYLDARNDDLSIDGEGAAPAPVDVEACVLASAPEVYEGRLVRVQDVIVSNPSAGAQTFQVEECLIVGTEFFPYQTPPYPKDGEPFHSITGPVSQNSATAYRLQPRTLDDLNAALFSYAEPGGQSFVDSITVTLKANQSGSDIFYTTDGSEPVLTSPSIVSGSSVTLTETTTLKFFAMSDTETETVVHEEVYTAAAGTFGVLITEVSVQGTDQEFIEIYNPGNEAVDLSTYYLTDLSNAITTTANNGKMTNEFVKVVNNAVTNDNNDFLVKFPDGTMLAPKGVLVITTAQSAPGAFLNVVKRKPDFEIKASDPDVADMVLVAGSNPSAPGLSNAQEFVLLFKWDGASALVQDVDYIRWAETATNNVGMDRTGLTINGSTYKPDLSLVKEATVQAGMPRHQNNESLCRIDLAEGTEVQTGGNGVDGADESSENFLTTWKICSPYTPGTF